MPDEDPAHDPQGNADITENEDDMFEYVINAGLHTMISAAEPHNKHQEF